jgi:hypothetical protein
VRPPRLRDGHHLGLTGKVVQLVGALDRFAEHEVPGKDDVVSKPGFASISAAITGSDSRSDASAAASRWFTFSAKLPTVPSPFRGRARLLQRTLPRPYSRPDSPTGLPDRIPGPDSPIGTAIPAMG